jgi:NADH-quinone oxidoreductase subunit C
MQSDQVRGVAESLLTQGYYLVFVSAVHVAPTIEVIYQFAHFDELCRVKARVSAGEACQVPTISDIFQGASWHERETRDFFGVDFAGHPNLTPLILAEEDADLKPLLKDEKSLKSVEAIRWMKKDTDAEKPQKNQK